MLLFQLQLLLLLLLFSNSFLFSQQSLRLSFLSQPLLLLLYPQLFRFMFTLSLLFGHHSPLVSLQLFQTVFLIIARIDTTFRIVDTLIWLEWLVECQRCVPLFVRVLSIIVEIAWRLKSVLECVLDFLNWLRWWRLLLIIVVVLLLLLHISTLRHYRTARARIALILIIVSTTRRVLV